MKQQLRPPDEAYVWTPRAWQKVLFGNNYVKSDGLEGVPATNVCAHRRAGKTEGIARKIQKDVAGLLLHQSIFKLRSDVDSRNPQIGFLASTQNQAKRVVWKALKFTMSVFPGVKFNEQQLTITIPRPHLGDTIEIFLLSFRNHEFLRGMKFMFLYIDEVQNLTEAAFKYSILSSLADSAGKLLTTGTACSAGFYAEMLRESISTGIPSYILPLTDTGVFSVEEQKEWEKRLGPIAYAQEMLCDFQIGMKGAFYADILKSLEKEGHGHSQYIDHRSTVLAVDIGVGKGFCGWLGQPNPFTGTFEILDYFEDYLAVNDLRTDVEETGYKVDVVIVPHDAEKRQVGADSAPKMKTIFKNVFAQAHLKQTARPANKAAVISEVASHLHLLRWPDPMGTTNAYQGRNHLMQYSRAKDKEDRILDRVKKDGHDHAADALSYLMMGLKMREGRFRLLPTFKAEYRESFTLRPRKTRPEYLRNRGSLRDSFNTHTEGEDMAWQAGEVDIQVH